MAISNFSYLCSFILINFIFFFPCVVLSVDSEADPFKTENSKIGPYHAAFPLIEPDSTHTHLKISKDGILAISRIKTPIAIVSVIGPYRSGKSFLLNQLLSLSCSEGFGVGHQRETQTKGVWVWGEPFQMNFGNENSQNSQNVQISQNDQNGQISQNDQNGQISQNGQNGQISQNGQNGQISQNGQNVSVFFFDTEGFESVGKSTVYDDRIFALATIISSVLIYNLPETVKEADISKLSFAVELADEFFGRVKGRENSFEPAHLLWLIQRDFLEGKTVQEMVDSALLPISNTNNDPDVEQVNKVRKSLRRFSENGTAFGLRQPHLQRTKLCELKDKDLDSTYINQRKKLKNVLKRMIFPKRMGNTFLNGEEFASLIEQTLDALNVGVIPSAGSVIETFNLNVIKRCVENYKQHFSNVLYPIPEEELEWKHSFALALVQSTYEKERFGNLEEEQALIPLQVELSKAYENFKQKNELSSSKKCEKLYAQCEDELEDLQKMLIPSTSKFDQDYKNCLKNTQHFCIGPSKDFYIERLNKMWTRERTQFLQDYNHRLFNLLVTVSFLFALTFRFIFKIALFEILCWALFLFLETYTRLFWSIQGLYSNPVWVVFISVWELVVYNSFFDLNKCIIPFISVINLFLVYRFFRFCRKKVSSKTLPVVSRDAHKE